MEKASTALITVRTEDYLDGVGKYFSIADYFQGKPHFWSDMIVSHLFFITVLDNVGRYPIAAFIGRHLLPRLTVSVRGRHSRYSRDMIARQVILPFDEVDGTISD